MTFADINDISYFMGMGFTYCLPILPRSSGFHI